MPSYDFKCPSCGRVEEFGSREIEPVCQNEHEAAVMKRVFTVGGISFKGYGFYSVDSKIKKPQ